MGSKKRLSAEERILASQKHLALSLEQIRDRMNADNGCLRNRFRLRACEGNSGLLSDVGTTRPAVGQCPSYCIAQGSTEESIASIGRGMFETMEGTKGHGFHRHIWDPVKRNCEQSKMALPLFKPQSVEEFILQGFTLMGIAYEPGTGGLQW